MLSQTVLWFMATNQFDVIRYDEKYLVYPFDCTSTSDWFTSINRGDSHALRRCAIEFCEDQAIQGVLYTEVRYAPQLMSGKMHTVTEDTTCPSLTNDEVVQILLDAFAEGSKRYGIKVNSILGLFRPKPGANIVLLYIIVLY